MRGRGQRAGERGAESLEFLGLLPLFIFFVFFAWHGLILLRQSTEAEQDAQTIARAAALCGDGSKTPSLWVVDPNAGAESSYAVTPTSPYVKVHVALQPNTPFQDFNLQTVGFPAPAATVVMRLEPCK
jgi:Flp pilus assembly protein TadG